MIVGMIFIHPVFLWGLLAVLIPIAVHLFNFRRYKKVYFSNVERLSELHTERRRRNNLRNWLVLAARVLAVVFVVLAFAQPVTGPRNTASLHQSGTVVSIFIDNSFSMESASSDGSQLDAARQKAREVADTYGPVPRYQLMTCQMEGHEMRWLSRDELLEALEGVEPSAASPTLSEVAARQSDFMRQSGAPVRHAFIISDFQQTVADLDALPDDSTALFTLVPVEGVEADNVYIDTLVLDAPAYFTGGSVDVDVTLRNSGSRDVEKVPVKLFVDGRERALATVDLAAGASATATLRFSIDHAGWIDGRVEVEDYPVTFDDRYHFTLLAGEPIALLEVDAAEPNSALRRLFGADSAIDYRTARHLPPETDSYNFIILNELTSLTSGEVQQLAAWVADGGNLLVVPAADNATGLAPLMEALQAPRPARWVKRQVRASTVDYAANLYRSVFNGKNDEMEMPSVQGHYTLDGSTAVKQSIIGLADGGDLLTVTPSGVGRVFLFTTPLTTEWTDLTGQALFVPTLYNMALYSRALPPASHTLGDNAPLPLQGSYDLERQPPELTGDGVRFIPDLRRVGHRQTLVLHGELTAAGLYQIGDEHLAFNYSRRESELRFLTPSEVAKAVDGRVEYTVARHSHRPLGDELRHRDGGHRLWRVCLLLALAALAAETVLLKLRIKK